MQKVLHLAKELHNRGYEKLRVLPSLSPSGLYWRCSFSIQGKTKEQISSSNWIQEFNRQENEIIHSVTLLTDLFENEYKDFLEKCKGEDKKYSKWYRKMLESLQTDELPYAYADFFTAKGYWQTSKGNQIKTLPSEPSFD